MARILTTMLAAVLAFGGVACATDTTEKQDSDDVIRKAMEKAVPNMKADRIEKSEVPGFYEATYGSDIFYVSEDGRYLFSGVVVDLDQEKNLTEAKRSAGRLKMISSIDESKMIIFSPKEETKHTITVFTDIDCPYCRRMHQEMDQLNAKGIKVRYMLFPRAGVGSKSYKKAIGVWCSEDRQQALTDAKAGKDVPEKTCDNPVDEHMALVQRLGITGTPTSILEDGSMIPGYLPADRLERALESE